MSGEIPPAIGDFPAGSQITSYQIEQLIGRGGMAVVYRAVDVRLGRPVALKILAPELARDDAFRQRFIRESRAGAAVDHPNIIPVFEAGEAENVLFIAMRYVAGQDVRALIERTGRLSARRAVGIVTQVASALDAAHAHGLIHRDVKPANMLLASVGDGRTPDHVYLSDFGLSKQAVSTGSLTRTGQFLGTIDYMSPEQVEGRPTDGRTDLYALACAAFEMLTGDPPFRREQNLAVMWAQVSATPPSVLVKRPDLPPEVDQVMAKALAKSPADRHPSCLEFAAALRAACVPGREAPADQALTAAAGPATELAGGPLPAGGTLLGGPAGGRVPAVEPGQAAALDQEATITELQGASGNQASGSGHPGGSGYGGGPGYQGGPGQGGGPGYQGGPGQGGGPGYSGGPPYGGGSGYGAGPGYQPGAPSAPPGLTSPLAGVPSYPPQGQGPRRGKGLPIAIGSLIVLALAAAAVLVLRGHGLLGAQATPSPTGTTPVTVSPSSPPPSQSGTASPSPSRHSAAPASASSVVLGYFNAINSQQYRTAWNLVPYQHSSTTFATFKQGYAQTQHDTVTIVGVSGGVVTIRLAAHQTDGTVKFYHGTYTVRGGVIIGSSILPG